MDRTLEHTRSVGRELVYMQALVAALLITSGLANPSFAQIANSFDSVENPQESRLTDRSMDPPTILKHTTDRLLSAIESRRDEIQGDIAIVYDLVDEHASPHIDYDLISRRILGRHWRRANDE